MAQRVGIRQDERDRLVAVLAQTKDWDKAKATVIDIDPKVLDAGFKEWAHKKAGVPLSEPVKAKPDPLK